MHFPFVTIMLAAFFAFLSVALSIQTSLRRKKLGVGIGDGGDETLQRRVRAHGNFIEYAPMSLILLGLVEIQGAARSMVLSIGFALALARLLHAAGMLYAAGPGLRGAGMMLQHAAYLFCGTWLAIRLLAVA